MSARELVVLGTASQVPTRTRGHNGYILRFDADTLLFDPGEGTQRHMLHASVSASALTRIALTHLHGDHALGLPGVVQRLSLDDAPNPVPLTYPAAGEPFVDNLLNATVYAHRDQVVRQPLHKAGPVDRIPGERHSPAQLHAVRLDHAIDTYGYRLIEPDTRTMDPGRLAAAGIEGPAIGVLSRDGYLDVGPSRVTIENVSLPRPGQRVGFCMDTRLCDGAYEIAENADLLVVESTFLHSEARLATEAGHLTARQAAQLAADQGVRTLVLTHFSGRYTDPEAFAREAREVFTGTLHIAADSDRIDLPPRRAPIQA